MAAAVARTKATSRLTSGQPVEMASTTNPSATSGRSAASASTQRRERTCVTAKSSPNAAIR